MNIAIITACPSGVANSIIAAGLLEKAANQLKFSAKIECQSSVLAGDTISAEDIAQAEIYHSRLRMIYQNQKKLYCLSLFQFYRLLNTLLLRQKHKTFAQQSQKRFVHMNIVDKPLLR